MCTQSVARTVDPTSFFFYSYRRHRDLHSFPTRRSSDLLHHQAWAYLQVIGVRVPLNLVQLHRDRKSTRLNSSHPSISYAVFCLKKKKTIADESNRTPTITPTPG